MAVVPGDAAQAPMAGPAVSGESLRNIPQHPELPDERLVEFIRSSLNVTSKRNEDRRHEVRSRFSSFPEIMGS